MEPNWLRACNGTSLCVEVAWATASAQNGAFDHIGKTPAPAGP